MPEKKFSIRTVILIMIFVGGVSFFLGKTYAESHLFGSYADQVPSNHLQVR